MADEPIAGIYGSTWQRRRDEVQAQQEEHARQQREQLARDTERQLQALRDSSQSAQMPQMPQIPGSLLNMLGGAGGEGASASGASASGASGGSAGGALASAGPWAALAAAVIANETSARNGGYRRNGLEYVGDLISGDVAYQDADRVEKATGSKALGTLWKAATVANPVRILKALF